MAVVFLYKQFASPGISTDTNERIEEQVRVNQPMGKSY